MKKIIKLAAAALVLVLCTALLPMMASAADTFTLHANVPESWTEPGFYGWGGSLSMSWPGEAMTDEGNGWYSYEVPADATGLIVNANGGSSQTNDITGFEAKEMWVVCSEDRTFTVYYEQPELPDPEEEAVVSESDAVASESDCADGNTSGDSFFAQNLWLFAIGAAVVVASGAAGAVLGAGKGRRS